MPRRSLLSLAAATAIAVIVAIVLLVSAQVAAVAPQPGGDPMFPALAERIDDLNQMVVETPRYRLVLESRDGQWVAVDQGDYPVKAESMGQLVNSLLAMTTVEPKTDNPALYGYVDVAGPATTPGVVASANSRISARAANGDLLFDAVFGRESGSIPYSRVGGTFVRRADEAQVWLVEGKVTVPGFLQEWFDPLLHVPGTELARVAILIGDAIVYDAAKTDFVTGNYELTFLREDIGPAGATANDDVIRSVAGAIVSTAFDNARPRDTVAFAPDARTVRFVTRQGLQLDLAIGEAEGEAWIAYTASAEPGTAAAAEAEAINARTALWAFKLPSYRVAALSRPMAELFNPPAPPAQAPALTVPGAPLLPGPIR